MDQCYNCGDFCPRSELEDCTLCKKLICIRCSMSHFREHELDGDFNGRGEAFYREEDLDESEIPDGDW